LADWSFFRVVLQIKICSFLAMNSSEQKLNRFLHAIADPTRRRILQALKERGACSIGKDVGLCASDIELRVHLSQPTISHHMSVLKKAGLVEAKKLGQWMWYRRKESTLREFTQALPKSL
jgi:DNA-binding transcriptional ArsR family regulator